MSEKTDHYDNKGNKTGYSKSDGKKSDHYDNKGNKKGYSKESSGGGCYLTTACIRSEGLPDDCLELTALRSFRDYELLRTQEGKKLIEEYYKLAPQIVSAINLRPDATGIWKQVYGDIQVANSLLMSGLPKEATEYYREMTLRLKKLYISN